MDLGPGIPWRNPRGDCGLYRPLSGARPIYCGPSCKHLRLKKVEILNELIYDPAHKLENDIYRIPDGGPWFWLVEALFDEDKIPKRQMNLLSWDLDSLDDALPQFPPEGRDPPQISATVKTYGTQTFFPFVRPPFPQSISAAKLKWNRKKEKFEEDIESLLGDLKNGRKLYRAVSRKALINLTALFCPVITSSHMNNQFGPGFYASPSLETVITYCIPNSALLIFDDPENLSRYTLKGEEWETIIRYWTDPQVGNLDGRIPPQLRDVDIIEGAISKAGAKQKGVRVEGDEVQVVGVSNAAIKGFASALRMVIWFT
ncbi:unnamed protein product [Penicillium pancosmium]